MCTGGGEQFRLYDWYDIGRRRTHWWILGGVELLGVILGGVEPRPYVEYLNT